MSRKHFEFHPLFNIRFGTHHLKVHRSWPYVTWEYNSRHEGNPTGKKFAVYTWFGKSPFQKENK